MVALACFTEPWAVNDLGYSIVRFLEHQIKNVTNIAIDLLKGRRAHML